MNSNEMMMIVMPCLDQHHPCSKKLPAILVFIQSLHSKQTREHQQHGPWQSRRAYRGIEVCVGPATGEQPNHAKSDFNSDWELMMDSLGDSGIFPGFCLCFFLGPVAFASAGGPVEI